ncbi:MAG: DUF4260 domain-containing protein [Ignavibacteriae bacterium]|nr:DUF4260 domain-containing protein [Ignavibacteriota bacterium]MCB9214333.1 DUF4260 domain-containing protein [Ignavibacteria bacterium]
MVTGIPRILLRIEGVIVLLLSLHFYNELDGSWVWFAILFLAPDLSFFGYVGGKNVGSIAYNTAHTYISPAMIAALGYTLNQPELYPFALIWTAHIGFDRLLGYGLKYLTDFKDTHLGSIGRVK